MRMQEPEPRQRSEQDALSEPQRKYSEGVTEDDPQLQKIYPQEWVNSRSHTRSIIAIVFSSLGFFITIAGIVFSAIVLRYANGRQEILMRGVIGLVGSIMVMLVCIAVFVIAVVVLAFRSGRVRRKPRLRI